MEYETAPPSADALRETAWLMVILASLISLRILCYS